MFRTKASTYAILGLLEIAQGERSGEIRSVQAADIAQRLDLPAAYAAKVLTQLARAGLLHSDRGPHGGFRLARPLEEISLLGVIEAVDGPLEETLHIQGGAEETAARLGVTKAFAELSHQVREYLRSRTLADLLRQVDSGRLGKSGVQAVSSLSGRGEAR